MAFGRSPARYPERAASPDDPRFLDLFVDDPGQADVLLAGIPFDGAVLGRKGCRAGPTAVREAFRYLGGWDADREESLKGLRIHDLGDTPTKADDARKTHAIAEEHLTKALRPHPSAALCVLGGDNSLSFATFTALHAVHGGKWGVVVLDAHYDLRPVGEQPSSGTPYRRILTEVKGTPVKGPNLVEVGIRPYANAPSLAAYAKQMGVHVVPMAAVRDWGIRDVARYALEHAGRGADHLFLSVDIDGLDHSIAPGCTAPGAGGLTFEEASHLVRAVAADPRCRGMDLVEVAPDLDPTGNTARVAAQLVAHFAGGIAARNRSA
jgi:formiminoglutamase